MRNRYLLFLFAAFIVFGSVTFTACKNHAETEIGSEEDDMYDGPDKAILFEIERTKDPATGKVPWDKLWLAIDQTRAAKERARNTSSSLTPLVWAERGPNSDVVGSSNGNTRANGGVTAGRVRAAIVDSADATHKTVWIGGVDGGLWKTTDITAFPATWQLVNDNLSNLAVSAICQDPSNNNIMYFCTGESYSNADAVSGVGVFKSTDHGVTWNLLPSTTSFTAGTRILCDYQGNVYLGTRNNGLQRSTNGGSTWTNITPTGITASVCDLEISSTSGPARLHVVLGIFSTQAYRYTDIPSTVTSATWTAPTTDFASGTNRAEISILGNTLYACPSNASYQVPTIYKSTDGGDNWAPTAGQPAGTWASGQAWYSLATAINPADANQCIVGGLDCYKTTDGGATWTKISAWVGTAGQYVHADQHNMQWWDGGNKLLFTCDGGVHFSADGGTTIRDRNVGLRLKQFYSIAIHPSTTNYFLAGAQDNGTHSLSNPGLSGSVEVTGGDGAYVAIDQDEPQYQFGAYVYNQYRRTTNGGASWGSVNFSSSAGRFINPFDYDNTGNILYAAYTAGSYLRWDNPQTGATNSIISITAFNGGTVSAVHVSPYTANRVYFGTGVGRIVRVDNANTATPTETNITPAGLSGYVNCIVTGASDNNLIACVSSFNVNNVWLSNDGGTTWTQCDGNLPNMPVRWALFHPDDNTKAYIATETGVWETDLLNGASTVWNANSTFPNVRTDMIKYRSSDRTIAAGTHGRGVWTATVPAFGCTPPTISAQPASTAVCNGSNASFSVTAAGSAPFTYQWEVSTNGGSTWAPISGANSSTYSFTATAAQNNYQYHVIVGNCDPSSVTSNAATLTVNALPAVTGQPSNVTICAGSNASFSVTATGSGLTYQWQVSTNGGSTFTNLTNTAPYSTVTTNTLSITAAPAGLNTYQYRCVVSGTCTPPATSNAGVLTVNATTAVTGQPANASICAGNNTSFTVTVSGGLPTYQWQLSTDGGTTFNNLTNVAPYSGVTTATLSITAATLSMNTYQYRCVVNSTCGPLVNSNAATLTVGSALSITSHPVSSTICAGSNTSFGVSVTGTVISYQWQVSTDGGTTFNNLTNTGVYSGATTATLNLTGATAGMNGYQYRCIVTGSCPSINSNAATLTINTAPAITTQPAASSTICSGSNTGFTVVATGTSLTYQWQVSTDGGTSFNNLSNTAPYSGVTTASLNITAATPALNTYQYRCVISGTCAPAATTAASVLTVNTPVAVTTAPVAAVQCAGGNASFTVAASGTTPAYQWQESTDGGTTFSNITNAGVYSGATSATLSLTGITAGMTGNQYRCVITGAAPCGTATSTAATLTVNTAPAITTQPAATSNVCSGQNTGFSVTANGTALTYQWQVSTDGGTTYNNLVNVTPYGGVTTSSLTLTGVSVPMSGYRFRCVISGTCTPSATTSSSLLTVYTPVSISTQPANITLCETANGSMTVVAAGTSPTYQWQVSTNGGTSFSNITGATSATLSLNAVVPSQNGNIYHCVVTGTSPCGAVTSNNATLTVNALPHISLAAAPYLRLLPGLTTTLTATANPVTVTYAWYKNNVVMSGVTGTTLQLNVNGLGDYKVNVTDGNGCSNVSNVVTISDSASGKFFIYPSPNSGKFTVSYYNQGGQATTQQIIIFSSKGEKVFQQEFQITQAWQLLPVDLSKAAKGIYYIVLGNASGAKVRVGEVVIQ